jgi:hypothetical protein
MLKTLLKSKKFLVSLSGVLFVLLNQTLGLNIPEATVAEVVGLMAAYVIGQGFADKGKEAVKEDLKGFDALDG